MNAEAPLSTEAPPRIARRGQRGPSKIADAPTGRTPISKDLFDVALSFGTVLPDIAIVSPPQTHVAHTADAAAVCNLNTDLIMAAIQAGCPYSMTEKALGVRPGTLSGFVLSSRELMLRYAISLCAAADELDKIATGFLRDASAESARQIDRRSRVNASNTVRCMAEGKRRLGESMARRASEVPKQLERQARAAHARASKQGRPEFRTPQ